LNPASEAFFFRQQSLLEFFCIRDCRHDYPHPRIFRFLLLIFLRLIVPDRSSIRLWREIVNGVALFHMHLKLWRPLAEYLKENRHDIYRHVIATETADLSALTAAEIEVIVKRHMIVVA
jgi:hypothetical protein